jgi:hypothetical protein
MPNYMEICRDYEQFCTCVKPNTELIKTVLCGYEYSKPFNCPYGKKVVCGFYAAIKVI